MPAWVHTLITPGKPLPRKSKIYVELSHVFWFHIKIMKADHATRFKLSDLHFFSLILHWSLLRSPRSFLRLRSACILSFASCVKLCAKILNIVPVTFFKLALNIKLVAFTTFRAGRQNASKVLSIRLIFVFRKTFALINDSHHDKAEILSFLARLITH